MFCTQAEWLYRLYCFWSRLWWDLLPNFNRAISEQHLPRWHQNQDQHTNIFFKFVHWWRIFLPDCNNCKRADQCLPKNRQSAALAAHPSHKLHLCLLKIDEAQNPRSIAQAKPRPRLCPEELTSASLTASISEHSVYALRSPVIGRQVREEVTDTQRGGRLL